MVILVEHEVFEYVETQDGTDHGQYGSRHFPLSASRVTHWQSYDCISTGSGTPVFRWIS